MFAVTRPGDAEPLAAGAVKAGVEHIKAARGSDHIRIGDSALVEAAPESRSQDWGRVPGPAGSVLRPRQPDLKGVAGLVPVKNFVVVDQRRSVGGNVAALPPFRRK